MATKKTIKLKRLSNGEVVEYNFGHALNILRYKPTKGITGWEISEENWIFENNEICKRPKRNSDS